MLVLVKKLHSPAHKWPCAARGLFHVHHVITTSWTSALRHLHFRLGTLRISTILNSAPPLLVEPAIGLCLACFKAKGLKVKHSVNRFGIFAPIPLSENGAWTFGEAPERSDKQHLWKQRVWLLNFVEHHELSIRTLDLAAVFGSPRCFPPIGVPPSRSPEDLGAAHGRSASSINSNNVHRTSHGFSKQTQRKKRPQLSKPTKVKCCNTVDSNIFFHKCDCLGTKRAGFDSAVLRIQELMWRAWPAKTVEKMPTENTLFKQASTRLDLNWPPLIASLVDYLAALRYKWHKLFLASQLRLKLVSKVCQNLQQCLDRTLNQRSTCNLVRLGKTS